MLLCTILLFISLMFQFPPNGKAHVDPPLLPPLLLPMMKMFQFPPNGKAHVDEEIYSAEDLILFAFQFPPNGKAHVDLLNKKKRGKSAAFVFQFPPNGKAHVDITGSLDLEHKVVVFQFPPNGKAHVDMLQKMQTKKPSKVSIPSEREGTCRPTGLYADGAALSGVFQFPPNGKAHVDVCFILNFC